MRLRSVFVTALVGAVVVPASGATAKTKVIAPPGDSAVSQYVEDVPTDRGATPSQPAGTTPTGVLTPAQRRALDSRGTDGRVLAGVVSATAPAGVTALVAGANGPAQPGGAQAQDGGDPGLASMTSNAGAAVSGSSVSGSGAASPTTLLVRAVTGGGSAGVGALLIALMVVSVVGGIGWSLRRRRSGP